MIAISSRALFDMTSERKVYDEQGLSPYLEYMMEHENTPLRPGSAFPFIQVRVRLK